MPYKKPKRKPTLEDFIIWVCMIGAAIWFFYLWNKMGVT